MDSEAKPGNRKGRPNYPVEFKRRLAAAACEAGVSVSKFRVGLFDDAPQAMPALLPVVLSEAFVVATAATAQAAASTISEPIEVILADTVVRVSQGADAALLRTIFQSLRA